MSTTEQPPTEQGGPRVGADEVRDLGRLRRTVNGSPEGRHLGGVAGGLARHLDIDPVIVRVLLVVLVFFGGAGILLYAAGWLFIPPEDTNRAPIDLDERTRSFVLYIAGGISVLAILGDSFGHWDFPWPILAIGLIALVVLGRGDRFRAAQRSHTGPTAPPPGHTAPPLAGPAAGSAASATTTSPVNAESPATGPTAAAPGVGQQWTEWQAGRAAWKADWQEQKQLLHPRRRGPILFWFTLALIALLEGVLGLADVAGADVSGSAYAALAVGVTGVMLVLGAFWGRAGGLILVGLATTMWLVGSVAAQEIDGPSRHVYAGPTTTAAAISGDYEIGAGEMLVDLTRISDPTALDGHRLKIGAGVGKISVVVPDEWSVHADAQVGVGEVQGLDGSEHNGLGIDSSSGVSGDEGQPDIDLDVHLGVGSIEIRQESDFRWPDYSGWSTR